MSKEPENKRIKFSDENVDYYERLFMIEHNRAMGYTEREPEAIQIQHMSTQISLVEAANAAFLVPFQLHMKLFECGFIEIVWQDLTVLRSPIGLVNVTNARRSGLNSMKILISKNRTWICT